MWVRRKLSGLVLVVLTVGRPPRRLCGPCGMCRIRACACIRHLIGISVSFRQAGVWLAKRHCGTLTSWPPLLDAQFQDTRLVSLSVLTDTRQLFYHRDGCAARMATVRPGIFVLRRVASWGIPWRSFVMAWCRRRLPVSATSGSCG